MRLRGHPLRLACLALVALLGASPRAARAAEARVERFHLENGLTVLVRQVAPAEDVCVLVLFDVGEDHDPSGKSGLAHLVEHCYVTSAAGDRVPARTAEAMMQAYPLGWNAQTGRRYTVVAFVEPRARLGAALREAALRMGDLRITDAEVEREKGRVLQELDNMFEALPPLAARNRATQRVVPSPRGGRRGGVPAHVAALTPEDVRAWHARCYRPRHARLVLTGGVDPAVVKGLVQEAFADVPGGEPLPSPGEDAAPAREETAAQALPAGPGGSACLAFRAPLPRDPAWAPFLVLAARTVVQSRSLLPIQVSYAPLDDPDVLLATIPADPEDGADPHEERMRRALATVWEAPTSLSDRMLARQVLAPLLATIPLPDVVLARNLYGLAFGLARRDQWGLDAEQVARAIDAVTEEDLARVREGWLSKDRGAVVVARPRP